MATHSSIFALKNPMDRGDSWATVHEVAKESDITQQLNNNNNIKIENTRVISSVKYVLIKNVVALQDKYIS